MAERGKEEETKRERGQDARDTGRIQALYICDAYLAETAW